MFTEKEYLGYVLKCIRENRNMSLSALREKTELSKASLSNVETGKNNPTVDNFEKICLALNVSSEFVLTLTKKVRNYVLHSSSKEIFENLHNMILDEINKYDSGDFEYKSNLNYLGKFTTPKEAMEFILEQPVIGHYGEFNINELSDEDKINFANDLLNVIKMISPKYKK